MENRSFDTPVIVNLHSDSDRDVKSVEEALAVLVGEWPVEAVGPAHTRAVQACRDSLDGQPVEKARDAFSAAAWEAGVFVSDIPLSRALG